MRTARTLLLALMILPPVLAGCANEGGLAAAGDTGLPFIQGVTPTIATAGQTVNVRGYNFGKDIGKLYLGDSKTTTAIPMTVIQWSEDFVRATLPTSSWINEDVPIDLVTADDRHIPVLAKIRIVAESPDGGT